MPAGMISSSLGLAQLLALVGAIALVRDALLWLTVGWNINELKLTPAGVPEGYRWRRFIVCVLAAAAHGGFCVGAVGVVFSVVFNLARLAGLALWI